MKSSRIVKILWSICLIMACAPQTLMADDDFEEFKRKNSEQLNSFRQKNEKEFEDFRKQANQRLADFMKRPWPEHQKKQPVIKPVEPEPEPVYLDEDEELTPPDPQPLPIKKVVTPPAPQPQPQPVSPIKPKPEPPTVRPVSVSLYGTAFTMRGADIKKLRLKSADNLSIAAAWSDLSEADTDNLLHDCLRQRSERKLCDWAYMQLLRKVADGLTPPGSGENALLTGFLLNQSGYKVRFGIDGAGKLLTLYAADGKIYDHAYWTIGQSSFYALQPVSGNSIRICEYEFPGEKELSLAMTQVPGFNATQSASRRLTVYGHPDISVNVSVNKNLIDFYNDYPTGTLGNDDYSRWAIYANVPASDEFRSQLYPRLRQAIAGKNQKDAANILIRVAQSFPYGFDDEIWGQDRAFFADESWFYPKSDCEDHAIHFSRLIRDLMGLDVVLVYYPGHLAAAVAFTDGSVTGDYVSHKGRRFAICDPTCFYADVGMTSRGYDNNAAILVDLTR